MKEKIVSYLNEPTPEKYAELRSILLGSPAYRPQSTAIHQFWDLIEADRLQEAAAMTGEIMQNYLLSPLAHTALAALAEKQGDTQAMQLERRFTVVCRDSLLGTGDGTLENPYRVTRVDDVYSVLAARRARLKQMTCRFAGGRILDEITTDQGELYFDVSAPFEAYQR